MGGQVPGRADGSLVCDFPNTRHGRSCLDLPEETSARYADGKAALMRSVKFHPCDSQNLMLAVAITSPATPVRSWVLFLD